MNELNKLICESIQTVGCLPRCNGEACFRVKEIVADIVKDVREEAINEFVRELKGYYTKDKRYDRPTAHTRIDYLFCVIDDITDKIIKGGE